MSKIENRKVIHSRNLPAKLPIPATLIWILWTDYYQVSLFWNIAGWGILAINWIYNLSILTYSIPTDIFKRRLTDQEITHE